MRPDTLPAACRHLAIGFLVAAVTAVQAAGMVPADLAPADLPDASLVNQVLDQHPAVLVAHARLRAAEAERDQLRAGEHEFGVSLSGQQRRVSGGPDYNEWEVGVERGVRLPGKARLDARIGAQGVREAEEKVGDARHEAARVLLSLWYGTLRTAAEADLWRRQVAVIEEQRRIAGILVQRGDAARLDSLQADATLAQVRAESSRADAAWQQARSELRARFPGLPDPGGEPASPQMPAGDMQEWVEHVLEHNHELLAAQQAMERARLEAGRAEADRMPDPTLGLFVAREADGAEDVIGVRVVMPLPGEARRARQERLGSMARAMQEEVEVVRRRLQAEGAANWQQASAAVQGFAQLKLAAEAMARHATLTRRAYEMGELGLTETLLAQRAALEASLAEHQARLRGNEAVARLLLDAHRLWPLPEGDDHPE